MIKKIEIGHFPLYLVFYEIAAYLSNDAYLPAIPQIASDLGSTHNLALFTFTAWFLGSVVVQLFLGPLSDRYGRRPIILIGGVFFILSNLFCALSTNIVALIVARFMQGMTIPSMIIAGYAAIHESLGREESIKVLARMGSITILAPSLGPLAGAFILTYLNWHWIFIGLGLWGFAAVGMLYLKMPETLPLEKREKSIHVKNIMQQYKSVLTNTMFMRHLLAACFLVGGLIAWMIAGTFLIIKSFNHTVIYFGVVQAIIFGCFIIGTLTVKRYMNNDNLSTFLNVGMGLSLIGGVLGTVLGYFFPQLLYSIIIALMLVTIGAGLCFPVLLRLTVESSDAPMGIRMTIVSGTQMASVVVCSSIMNAIYNGTLLSLGVVVLGFAIVALLLKPRIAYNLSTMG